MFNTDKTCIVNIQQNIAHGVPDFHVLFLLFRKEHKAHSPSCNFITLKKTVESLTVEELLRLQKERQKFIIVSMNVQLRFLSARDL